MDYRVQVTVVLNGVICTVFVPFPQDVDKKCIMTNVAMSYLHIKHCVRKHIHSYHKHPNSYKKVLVLVLQSVTETVFSTVTLYLHKHNKFTTKSNNYHAVMNYVSMHTMCLQCFDAVGWAAGRASGL